MKKYLMSLAALMITLSATVLTSCNPKNEPENVVTPGEITPEPGTHVETLTIAFPEQTQTRVAIDGSYNLTGWELGDEVTLVKTEFIWGDLMGEFNLVGTYAFTCTNAANGTFTGTMPDPYTVNDCQLAFYNATGFDTDGDDYFYFSPKTRASQNMKDVVMLVAKNDGEGNFEMEIFGSILQVTNNTGADITASVKYSWFGYGWYYDYNQIFYDGTDFYDFVTSVAGNVNHQITLSKDAPTYVFIPVYDLDGGDEEFAVGLSAAGDAEDECSIVPFKTNPGNAKLFKKTLTPATTGSATVLESAGCPNNECGWVQLWENGPKWAVFNVGVTDGNAESYGGYYAWGGMTNQNNEHNTGNVSLSGNNDTVIRLWGSIWRMPTDSEFQDLLDNCTCTWTRQNDVNGLLCTGKGAYSANCIFLPGTGGFGSYVDGAGNYGNYWSSTTDNTSTAYHLSIPPSHTGFNVANSSRHLGFAVRAVLAE